MGKEIPLETRFRAEEMYIVDGLTYEQVAQATGVSISQLQRWGAESGWPERRREYKQAFADIKRNTVLLRQKLIQKAMGSLDPQDVYAVAALEKIGGMAAKNAAAGEDADAAPMEPVKINSPKEAADALSEVIERKINNMLTRPNGVDLNAIRQMKDAIALIEKMRAEHGADDADPDRPKGIDAETLKEIEQKIKLL
ncbi:MAG: hypothetical protein U5L07_07810 [Desulfobacterales bacterium]|nr:hypothetical protein [Desulfobacterales bacterium]